MDVQQQIDGLALPSTPLTAHSAIHYIRSLASSRRSRRSYTDTHQSGSIVVASSDDSSLSGSGGSRTFEAARSIVSPQAIWAQATLQEKLREKASANTDPAA